MLWMKAVAIKIGWLASILLFFNGLMMLGYPEKVPSIITLYMEGKCQIDRHVFLGVLPACGGGAFPHYLVTFIGIGFWIASITGMFDD